jgi:hypothetical protein
VGALEETAKATGGLIEALKGSPVALAMGVMNIALLVFLFYYLSRITSRTEVTVGQLFQAQDKLYNQWAVIVKDTNDLTEKTMHCILPDDAIKLLQAPSSSRSSPDGPQRPDRPAAPERPKLLTLPPIHPQAEKSMLFLPLAPPLTEPKEADPP